MGLAVAVAMAARIHKPTITPEDRGARERARQIRKDEELRQAKIRHNQCPGCDGKLIRGQKQKKNDYKRAWLCSECNKTHLL